MVVGSEYGSVTVSGKLAYSQKTIPRSTGICQLLHDGATSFVHAPL